MISNIAIISHYSELGYIQGCLKRMLLNLRLENWHVLLVSTFFNAESKAWCTLEKIDFLLRANQGRDFGAFQAGLRHYQKLKLFVDCKSLILLNDSVYLRRDTHLTSWDDFLRGDSDSVIGITDSFQNGYHLQSYALNIPEIVFNSHCWLNFWKNLDITTSREIIIQDGEIGLSAMLLNSGFRIRALHSILATRRLAASTQFNDWMREQLAYNYCQVVIEYFHSITCMSSCFLNPSHQLLFPLLFDGLPLVKRDLLESNSSRAPDPFLLAGSIDWFDNDELVTFLKPPIVQFKQPSFIQKILKSLYNRSIRPQR